MKTAPICLLTACKCRKFKLFGDSSQVHALDSGITCCYWSASLSNQLRALKAHSSLLCHWNWFYCPFSFLSYFCILFNSHGRVPLAGSSLRAEKSHTRAKMPHWSVINCDFMTWKCFLCYWPFVRGNYWLPIDFPDKGPGTLAALLAFCEGNHRSPMDSPHKGPGMQALILPNQLVEEKSRVELLVIWDAVTSM